MPCLAVHYFSLAGGKVPILKESLPTVKVSNVSVIRPVSCDPSYSVAAVPTVPTFAVFSLGGTGLNLYEVAYFHYFAAASTGFSASSSAKTTASTKQAVEEV